MLVFNGLDDTLPLVSSLIRTVTKVNKHTVLAVGIGVFLNPAVFLR